MISEKYNMLSVPDEKKIIKWALKYLINDQIKVLIILVFKSDLVRQSFNLRI